MKYNKSKLLEMSLEDLWRLFPIELSPHRPEWKDWAEEEVMLLYDILQDFSPTISHVGSTAIPDIQAKPIIDILVEIPISTSYEAIATKMEMQGYILMNHDTVHMSFNKGYTPAGYAKKVFHIHIRRAGDNDEIWFRDYLISHPDEARAYELLKQTLLPTYRNNRDGYTAQKTHFIKRILAKAKNLPQSLL